MDKKFDSGKKEVLRARYEAQKIAFAPVVFQAVRLLRDLNILNVIEAAGKTGLKTEAIAEQTGVSCYGVTVLCETGLSQDVLEIKDDCYILTNVGHFLQNPKIRFGDKPESQASSGQNNRLTSGQNNVAINKLSQIGLQDVM